MSPTIVPEESAFTYGRILVAFTVLSSFAALYGLSLACDPATYRDKPAVEVHVPTEQDFWSVPDTSHNKSIFAIRASLEERGFELNGGLKVSDDPLAGVRAVYSFIAPSDEYPLEWRLMGIRCANCRPTSYLRLPLDQGGFSPEVAERMMREWLRAEEWLPAEAISTGEQLLREVVRCWEADSRSAVITEPALQPGTEIVERMWTDLPYGERRYDLRLRGRGGKYLLDLHLMDRVARPGELPSCDLVLQFHWMQ